MGEVFKYVASGSARRVRFDGSHHGRMKSEPGSQIELSLGDTHDGSEVPQMGPDSGGARSRRSDRAVPRRVAAQDG